MKKMVCEICGSTTIRKEGGVFVCQECGTEYSLEEARNLLREVGDAPITKAPPRQVEAAKEIEKAMGKPMAPVGNAPQTVSDKDDLIYALHLWANYIDSLQSLEYILDYDGDFASPSFWSMDSKRIRAARIRNVSKLSLEDFSIKDYSAVRDVKLRGRYLPGMYPKHFVAVGILGLEESKGLSQWLGELFMDFSNNQYQLTSSDGKLLLDAKRYPYLTAEFLYELLKTDPDADFDLHAVSLYSMIGAFFGGGASQKLPGSAKFEAACKTIRQKLELYKRAYEEYYREFASRFEECKEAYARLFDMLPTMCATFDVPLKYRNLPSVLALLELLYEGRADSWKEAVNLFEDEKYQAKVMNSLAALDNKLGALEQKVDKGFSGVNSRLDSMNTKLDSINSSMGTLINETRANGRTLERIRRDVHYASIRGIMVYSR